MAASFTGSTVASVTTVPPVDAVRAAFPALGRDVLFLENAGGSQLPRTVLDRMQAHLRECFVQLGADYDESRRATAVVADAHRLVGRILNTGDSGLTVLGASSTALSTMLAGLHADVLEPGDEIVVALNGHESNIGPWIRLARRLGVTVRQWHVDRDAMRCRLEDLEPLLGPRTRLVACTHVSNLLGEVDDVAAVARRVHDVGARIVVDGVAYAPHRPIDVQAWDVDWYFYSCYKVYGPHVAALYGRHEALAPLPTANHFFVPRRNGAAAYEPGGVSHEACAGLLGTGDYLARLGGAGPDDDGLPDRATIVAAFERMDAMERPLTARLVSYLAARDDVRLVGPGPDGRDRVGTISFVHATRSSQSIAAAVGARRIGIRHGHMYAWRLCEQLGLDPVDGVVRVSLVHYNTLEEIDRLIAVLDDVL